MKTKKLLALALVAAMTTPMFSVTASAEGEVEGEVWQEYRILDKDTVVYGDLGLVEGVSLNGHNLVVMGDFATSGVIDLEGGTMQVNGNFNKSGSEWALGEGKVVVGGNMTVSSAISANGGTIEIAGDLLQQNGKFVFSGAEITVGGNFTQLKDVDLSGGSLSVNGSYTQSEGTLDLNNGSVTVGNGYSLNKGCLVMNDPEDYMCVSGKFVTKSYGNTYSNILTDGTMELKGDFAQYKNYYNDNFNAKDNHKVIFSGTGPQTVYFEAPTASGFNIVTETVNPGVKITSGRINTVEGDVTIGSMVQYGTMNINSGSSLTVTGDVEQHGNISVDGITETPEDPDPDDDIVPESIKHEGGSLNISGDLIQPDGKMKVGNGSVNVEGNYRIVSYEEDESGEMTETGSSGSLDMQDKDGYLLVGGDFVTRSYGNTYSNILSDGTMELKGDFAQYKNYYNDNFNAKDNHKVIFSGTDLQTVYFEVPNSSGFNILSKTPNADVDITSGRINSLGGNVSIRNFIQYGSLSLSGYTLTLKQNLEQHGNIDASDGALVVKGNIVQPEGKMKVGNGSVNVEGNYRIVSYEEDESGEMTETGSSGSLDMQDKDGYLLVGGDFVTRSYGNAYSNILSDGTMEFKGDFAQYKNYYNDNFNAKENHKVIFSGTGLQKVYFEAPTASGFNILSKTSNTDVDITSGRINSLGGNVSIRNFIQYGSLSLSGYTLTLKQNLEQHGNIDASDGALVVKGNIVQPEGKMKVGNGSIKVDGDYRIVSYEEDENGEMTETGSSGYLDMQDKDGYLLVGGDFVTRSYGNAYSNVLTNGTMELKGNFAQYKNYYNDNFNAKENHKVVFSGTGLQTVYFEVPTASGFNILSKTSNTDVDITSGRINSLGGNVSIRNFVQYGSLSLSGYTLTLKQNLEQHGNIDVSDGALVVNGNIVQPDGKMKIGNGSVKVDGDYRIVSYTEDENGEMTETGSSGYLDMQDKDGYLLVGGDFVTRSYGNAYSNVLTNGTMEFKGNFAQYKNYYNDNFNAKEKHKVIFSGTGLQTVYFEVPNSSGFNILSKTPNTDVDITSGRINKLGGDVSIRNFVQYGSLSLSGYTLTLKQDLEQHGNIDASGGALVVKGNIVQPDGKMKVGNGSVRVEGDYRIVSYQEDENGDLVQTSSSGYLNMSDPCSSLFVGGDFVTMSSSNAYSNVITDGVMELKGDFSQYNTYYNDNFKATGNHVMILSGDDTQNIMFKSPNSSRFNVLFLYHKIVEPDYVFANGIATNYVNSLVYNTDLFNNSHPSSYKGYVNTPLTIYGSAMGGVPVYGFAYYYRMSDDAEWIPLDLVFGTDSKTEFVPKQEGTYYFRVDAADQTGAYAPREFSVSVGIKSLVNLSVISNESVPQNTSVTVNGKAEGGEGDLRFAFYYKKSTSSAWTTIGELYGKTTVVSFVPASVATYLVKVNVKDGTGKIVTKQFTVESTKPQGNDLVNKSTLNKTRTEKGSPITITGAASGGAGGYKYAFYYKKTTSKSFTAIGEEYGTAATAVFTPASAAEYNVRINVMDSNGRIVTKQYKIVSTAPLTNSSTISAKEVTKGTKITLNGKAGGGTAPYTYAYYYKKSTSSSWTKIGSGFSSATSAEFTPAVKATYNVKIAVKDKTGKTVEKTFSVVSK